MALLKKCRNQLRAGYDSVVEKPLQVSWNRRIWNYLNKFIFKSIGFCQSKLRFPATGDILRETQL
ncbi:MAG: hypothetical protein OEU55_14070, partial [Desulfobacterales bacterium]|nr:hypothetical protein [Desulfobacterales bacterium]